MTYKFVMADGPIDVEATIARYIADRLQQELVLALMPQPFFPVEESEQEKDDG